MGKGAIRLPKIRVLTVGVQEAPRVEHDVEHEAAAHDGGDAQQPVQD